MARPEEPHRFIPRAGHMKIMRAAQVSMQFHKQKPDPHSHLVCVLKMHRETGTGIVEGIILIIML